MVVVVRLPLWVLMAIVSCYYRSYNLEAVLNFYEYKPNNLFNTHAKFIIHVMYFILILLASRL